MTTNNYTKVAVDYTIDVRRDVRSKIFTFDDRDEQDTAVALAEALGFQAVVGGVLSVFRHVPGLDLPEIGRGGGFA